MRALLQKFLDLFFERGTEHSIPIQSDNSNSFQEGPQKVNKSKTAKVKTTARYRPQRIRELYDPSSSKLFKLSRSKLEMFIRCSRCFYLDRKLGINQPPCYPLTLNTAVDALLKKEFDMYRLEGKPHPICIENNINAIPFKHDKIEQWRNSLHVGIQYVVPNSNILFYGGVDDIWIDQMTKKLIIVDYKATSKAEEVSLDADWQMGYKRQAEMYQWLFRKNGFLVSNTAYFVYCNGDRNNKSFDKCLKFNVALLPYNGDDSWVEKTIMNAYECLQSDAIPAFTGTCDYCQYLQIALSLT